MQKESNRTRIDCSHVSECRGFDSGDCESCRNNLSIKPNYYVSNQANPIIRVFYIFILAICTYGLQFFLEKSFGLSTLLSAVITFFVIIIGSSALAIVYLERRSKNEQKRYS